MTTNNIIDAEMSAHRTVEKITSEVASIFNQRKLLLDFYEYHERCFQEAKVKLAYLQGNPFAFGINSIPLAQKERSQAKMVIFLAAITKLNAEIIPIPLDQYDEEI